MSCLAVTGETTGRQCWEVHKDAVTCIIEKHIKDPALVKRLVDAWDSAVDLGVTTAKASPAQKKKKTDRAIRLTSVRQATSVLLSQIGLIACKWCVYRGLHDCCLTTKKQFGQLGDSEQCCALSTQFTHPLTHTHTHNTQEYKPGDTKYSAKPANLRLKAPRNLSPKQVTEMEALLGCCNPCNSEAHNSGAARIVMGPYLALLAAQAELRALLGGAGPSQGSGEGEEEEEEQEHAEAAEEGAQGGGAPGEGAAGAGGGRRGSRKRAATDFLKPSGSKKQRRR